MEKCVLEVDGGGPKPRLEKERYISQRVHAKAGANDEEAVEPFEVEDGTPTHRLWHEKEAHKVAGRGRGDLHYGPLLLQRFHLRVEESHVISEKDAGDGRVRGGG